MNPIYDYIKEELSGFYPETENAALAKWVLIDIFHFNVTELYTGAEANLTTEDRARLENVLLRLKRYEPLQYIIGKTCFCGIPIEVTPDVLIPRPETEELIEWIVSEHPEEGLRVLDIGTGSGCIPIALVRRLKNASVAGWDVSEKALCVARRNAVSNQVPLELALVDILSDALPAVTADILVSNPPYIAEKEKKDMERNVLDWEPGLALFVPDSDPLLFYRRIAEKALDILPPGGCLYYEINRAYGKETISLLADMGYRDMELRKDLSGNDRMVKAVR